MYLDVVWCKACWELENALVLSSPYYNDILSLQNLLQISPINFHYYLSELN